MIKKLLISTSFILLTLMGLSQNAWLNEFHYDNSGTDVGEFVEVIIENPGNYTLSDFEVYLYNGSNGTTYDNESLDNFTLGTTVGSFSIYTWYPSSIQNGAPDGLALVYQGTVIAGQFLSYEGSLTATDGPANGQTSEDVGVSETSSTPIGESLQLSGSGTSYTDFTWNQPAPETPGNENNGQTLGGTLDPEPDNYPTNFTAAATGLMIENTWTDAVGSQLPSAYLVLISDQDNIVPPVDGVYQANETDLSDGMGALNIPYGDETCSFYKLNSETTYYFEIYPYTNAGANVDYKTDGTAPEAMDTTAYAINTNDFETGDFDTWISFTVASDKDWQVLDFGGALNTTWFAQMNGYNENEPSNDWLISPSLNFNNFDSEMMVFYTLWKYGDVDTELTLKYSTDYSGGDPTTATWTDLSFSKPADSEVWESSGIVDLSTISGDNVYIAFQYLSSGSPRRWNIDEIEISGDLAVPIVIVTSPNGGEVIEQGAEFEITWIYGFWDGNINIELVKEGENPEPIVYNIPLSDGSFLWAVLENQETGNDYKVRISGVNDDDPVGESEDYFSIIEPYILPEIVITEIMYNPPEAGDDSLEFLEFYNNGAELISMADFKISDGVGYTFPQGIEILPDTFLLVAKDSVAMWLIFGVEALQWTSGSLSNGGEIVELRDNFDNVIDFVPYDDYLPWDTLADGWGPSLTLCNPDLDNSLPESWTHSVHFAATNADGDSIWATPGFECQVSLFTGFEADKQVVIVGDSVMFTDLTTGNPTSWSWTFEGGTPETFDGQSPPYIGYNQPGMWNATLVVSDGVNTDSLTYVDYIYSGYLPETDFEADETVVIAGSYTNFTSLSTGDSLSFQWYFEGGTPDESTDENPQEIYYMINEWATYDVMLIVTNPFGSDTLTREDYIEVQPVGIIEGKLTDENVNLYPNPTNGEFAITLPVNVEAIVTITDLTSKVIMETESNGAAKLLLNGFDQGVYLVRIMDARNNSLVLKKLIIN